MQILPLVKNIFKKGLFLPVLVLGFLTVEAQEDSSQNMQANNSNQVAIKKVPIGTPVEISGTITDAANGQPLRAISVTYNDYSAAITDSAGHFTLKVPNG